MWLSKNYNGTGNIEKIYFLLLMLIIGTYATSMYIPIMEIDAAQYASISEQMLDNKSFLEIRHRDFEYLDKPPLLFWLSALSIKLFGVSSFAYKLPSVLALILAIFSTYRFSRLYYNRETSILAALVLASSWAFFNIANDCRTDNLLIAFSAFAIWQLASYIKDRKDINLVLGFIGIGFAMLAKGPLGLVFPVLTTGSMMLVQKNYKAINWKWLMAVPIISLMLLPMCVGLYRQHGIEGLQFYFWTQSFGRITGQSEWNNATDPFFFVHTFLWAFLPFSVIFLPAFYASVRDAIRDRTRMKPIEFASISGFILTMLALSFSKYKLPHYIFIILPLAAVILAAYWMEKTKSLKIKAWYIGQIVILAISLIFSVFIIYYFNSSYPLYFVPVLFLVFYLSWLFWKRFDMRQSIILISVLAIIFINLELNTLFYPRLLKYQANSEAAFYIKNNDLDKENIAGYLGYGHTLSYYLDTIVPYYWNIKEIMKMDPGTILYTSDEGLQELEKNSIGFQLIKSFDDFKVTHLNLKFLNPDTRDGVIEKRYLVRLKSIPAQ